MFHCHFTKRARIVQGDNLAAKTLDEAIAEGQRLLAAKPDFNELDGILIWDDSSISTRLSGPASSSPARCWRADAAPKRVTSLV
jgi:hypothetical protein